MSVPTGLCANRSRMVLDDRRHAGSRQRRAPGRAFVLVGTKAELMNGRRMKRVGEAAGPGDGRRGQAGMTAIHVNARVNRIRMPATASQAGAPACERKSP